MDIDSGGSTRNSGTDTPNPWTIVQGPDNIGIKLSTAPIDPGTSTQVSATVQSDPRTSQPMEVDQVVTEDHMVIDQPVSAGEPLSEEEQNFEVQPIPDWVKPIMDYMLDDKNLPSDETLARQIERRSKAYTIISRQVYKRSVTGVLQRCVSAEEGQEMLVEIHQGECGHHASSRALVAKVFRHGFYWPIALEQAEELVKRCNGCQRYANKIHMPAWALKTIPITWTFAVWGLDMVGNFKPAKGNMTHMLVMVDKFTKWIEAKPICKCDGRTAVKFLKDIIFEVWLPTQHHHR
jgi:hypothetical protein